MKYVIPSVIVIVALAITARRGSATEVCETNCTDDMCSTCCPSVKDGVKGECCTLTVGKTVESTCCTFDGKVNCK